MTVLLTLVILYALFHLVCGVLAYGFHFAYFQRQYPTLAVREMWDDVFGATIAGICGPVGLYSTWDCGFAKHGLLYRPSKR